MEGCRKVRHKRINAAARAALQPSLTTTLAQSSERCNSKMFFSIHYSRATYLVHGEDMYNPFPVRCPRSGGSLQAPLLPSAQACPESMWCAPRKLQRKKRRKPKSFLRSP